MDKTVRIIYTESFSNLYPFKLDIKNIRMLYSGLLGSVDYIYKQREREKVETYKNLLDFISKYSVSQ